MMRERKKRGKKKEKKKKKKKKTSASCLNFPMCSRATGWRIGDYLGQAVPSVVRRCREAGDGDDELQEACLQVGFWVYM
jgi:hypothetical protein